MSKSNISSKLKLLTLKRSSLRLFRDSRGLSTVEYVIILVLVAAVCVATWTAFGNKVKTWLAGGTDTIDAEFRGAGVSGGTKGASGEEPKKEEKEPSAKRKPRPEGSGP